MKNTVTFRDALTSCEFQAKEIKKRMSMLEEQQGDADPLSELWRADSRDLAMLRLVHIALLRAMDEDEGERRRTILPF